MTTVLPDTGKLKPKILRWRGRSQNVLGHLTLEANLLLRGLVGSAGLIPGVEGAAGFGNGGLMAVGPLNKCDKRRQEGLSEGRQPVAHRGRRRGRDLPPNQPVALEVAERLGEHPARDVGHRAGKRVEARRCLGECHEDQHRPLVAQPVEHVAHRACAVMHGQSRQLEWRPPGRRGGLKILGGHGGSLAVTLCARRAFLRE